MSKPTKESGSVAQDFRGIIRTMTADGTKPIPIVIHEIFDRFAEVDKDNRSKLYLTQELFDSAAWSNKQIRQKLSRPDLEELFDSIDESQSGRIEIEQLVNFCQRAVSNGRIYALKSRNAIISEFRNETEYRNRFNILLGNSNSKYVDN